MKHGANFRDQRIIKQETDKGRTPKEISKIMNMELSIVESFAEAHKASGKKAPRVKDDVQDGGMPL